MINMKRMRLAGALLALMCAANSYAGALFDGSNTVGGPFTISSSQKSVTWSPYPTSDGGSVVTSSTFVSSGKWYAAFKVQYTPTSDPFSIGLGWANQSFDPSSVASISNTGFGNIIEGGANINLNNSSQFMAVGTTNVSSISSSATPQSGGVIVVYVDLTTSSTWGIITPDGTNNSNLQSTLGNPPSGSLTIMAGVGDTGYTGSATITLLNSTDMASYSSLIPSGYSNIAD